MQRCNYRKEREKFRQNHRSIGRRISISMETRIVYLERRDWRGDRVEIEMKKSK
jgi:hypothetical protein